MMAVGTPELIRDMRRGRVPSVERFRALCEVLGLEFYVGPRRDNIPLRDLQRLERAIRTTENMLDVTERNMTPEQKAQVVSAVYHLTGEHNSPVGGKLVISLIDLAIGKDSRGSPTPVPDPMMTAHLPKELSIAQLMASLLWGDPPPRQ